MEEELSYAINKLKRPKFPLQKRGKGKQKYKKVFNPRSLDDSVLYCTVRARESTYTLSTAFFTLMVHFIDSTFYRKYILSTVLLIDSTLYRQHFLYL